MMMMMNESQLLLSFFRSSFSHYFPMKRVLVVSGPTGVGKTRLSLSLSLRLPVEVISGDSAQVFQGMDIGTDKVPLSLRATVPHHLLDLVPCTHSYTAHSFFMDATSAITVSPVPVTALSLSSCFFFDCCRTSWGEIRPLSSWEGLDST